MNRFESITGGTTSHSTRLSKNDNQVAGYKPLKWFMALLLVAFVAGCGSGNGGLGSTADTTAPTVSSTAPANTATGIALNANITATFSEAMDAATITDVTFTLKQGTTPVSGTVTYVGTTAIFNPTSNLTAGLVYTATVTTGVKDLAGNAMIAAKTWSFTTGTATDITPPTVSSTVPADAAIDVAINTNITAIFLEPMDASTITTTTFTLKKGTTPVSGAVSIVGTTATFNPTSDLTASTLYTATVTTGVKDLAGNAMTSNKVWSFTTGTTAAAGATPPNLGEAGRFVILASQTVTTTGASVVKNGDMGIMDQARSYFTTGNFTPIGPAGDFTQLTGGTSYARDDLDPPFPVPLKYATPVVGAPWATSLAMIDQSRTDLGIAYAFLAGTNPTAPTQTLASTQLGGQTLTPGVYYTASDVLITAGPLQLDAQGDANAVWIFTIDGTLTTGAPSGAITFVSGVGKAKNVYWRTGGYTKIEAGITFLGNVFAQSQVNVLAGANVTGSLFALTDQVTLGDATITKAP